MTCGNRGRPSLSTKREGDRRVAGELGRSEAGGGPHRGAWPAKGADRGSLLAYAALITVPRRRPRNGLGSGGGARWSRRMARRHYSSVGRDAPLHRKQHDTEALRKVPPDPFRRKQ